MMKKKVVLLITILLTISFVTACSSKKEEMLQDGSLGDILDYTNFIGKKIGVSMGSVSEQITQNQMNATPAYYTELSAGIEDMRKGRIDGYMSDLSTLKIIAAGSDDLLCLEIPAEVFIAPMGAVSNNQELIDRFNIFLTDIKTDGTLEDMQNRWLETVPDLDSPMPEIILTGENGTLKVATCGEKLPFSYIGANGEYKGYSIELIMRFAKQEGMDIEYFEMEFSALLPHAQSGKSDIAIANISITEERKKSILFTDSIYDDQFGILTLSMDSQIAVTNDTKLERDYTDFTSKTLGVITGGVYDEVVEDFGAVPAYYTAESAIVEDVRKGRIEGFAYDLSALKVIAGMEGNEDLECIDIPAEYFNLPMGALSIDQDIINRFNIFLSDIEADGTLVEMQNRWLESIPDLDSPMPDILLTGKNGTLKIAVSATTLPFVYMGEGGEYKGYSAELAIRFAAYEGMDIEFIDMDFGGLMPYVISGKADFAIANVSITEERKKSVLFTDPICYDRMGILALKNDNQTVSKSVTVRDHTEFIGKSIAVVTGSICDEVTEKINAIPAYYTEESAGIEDVRKGRIDGVMTALPTAWVITGTKGNEDLEYIEVPADYYSAPMGGFSIDQDIINRFNTFLADIKADGTLGEMQSRWFDEIPDLDSPMPDITFTGENGTLKVAVCATSLPFVYIGADGEFKGYSAELALRFAAYEGMSIEFIDMDFGGLISYIASGKADFAIADVAVTEERSESVIFTDSIYEDRLGVIVLKDDSKNLPKRDYTYFSGKNIANITGILTYITTEKIGAVPVYYSDSSAAAEDVRQGRAAGFMHALSTVRAIATQEGNEDFEVIAVPKEYFSAQIGGISQDQEVINSFNEFLLVIQADGTLKGMQDRWLSETLDLNMSIPNIPNTGENGFLKVVTCGDSLPYAYIGANGELTGFSVEMALRFGAYIGKRVEFADVEFGGLINYIVSEKADISLANMAITEERKQSVLFTEPFFDEQHGILTLKAYDETPATSSIKTSKGFIEWIKTGIERNLITDNRWKMVINGLCVTMIISLAAQISGTIFGCFICFILTRKNRFIKWIGNFYCALIHGTPVVVLLMITYYIIFGSSRMSSVIIAIFAFTMVEGAIIAQNLKGAIDTVDIVEIEAARSIGFSAVKAFITVTLPQAVRRALPSYTNGFIELVKSTAIVGYIAIQDLTRAGDIIRSRTYDAYFPLLLVAVIYLIVTAICVWIFKFIVKKLNGGVVL